MKRIADASCRRVTIPLVLHVVGCMLFIIFFAGYFSELVLATYLTYQDTILVNGVISACAYTTLYFCTETPPFLIMRKRYADAEKTLQWLRAGLGPNELKGELAKLKLNVLEEKEKRKSLKTLFTSTANAKGLCLVLGMHLIFTATGNSAINPHATLVFSPSETLTSNHFAMLYALGNFVCACVAPFVVSKINRRTLFMICFSVIALSHVSTFSLFHSRSWHHEMPCHSWLVYASVAIFGAARTMYLPAVFVLRGELLPLSIRAIGGSMATLTTAITGFSTSKMFLPIATYLGMEVNFLGYATMAVLMVFMVYFFLPETRGKSLDEIQNELKSGIKLDNVMKRSDRESRSV
jgi:SP family facilitated glucose transporter-like MFS transporter 8